MKAVPATKRLVSVPCFPARDIPVLDPRKHPVITVSPSFPHTTIHPQSPYSPLRRYSHSRQAILHPPKIPPRLRPRQDALPGPINQPQPVPRNKRIRKRPVAQDGHADVWREGPYLLVLGGVAALSLYPLAFFPII